MKHTYEDDEDIALVYHWNESLDKALCFVFAEIVRLRSVKDNSLLSSRFDEAPTLMDEFGTRDHEDRN
jgi:hypothetical protein